MTKWMAAALTMGLCAGMAGAQTRIYTTGTNGTVRVSAKDGGSYFFRTGAGEGQANNRTKDDLFAGTEQFEKNATSVTEIDMDPDSLDMVKGRDANAAHSTILNVVRTYSYDKPGMYNMADVDKYREKLNSGDWHCSVHTRELKTGESTDVCRKKRTDGLREDAIITVGPKELTFIHHIKRGNDDHSQMSSLPMYIGGSHSLPLVAELMPGTLAEMKANMELLKAEQIPAMAEMKAELADAMASGRMHVLQGDEFKDFGDTFRNFRMPALPPLPKLDRMPAPGEPLDLPPNVNSAPVPPAPPAAPAAPEREE